MSKLKYFPFQFVVKIKMFNNFVLVLNHVI